MKTIALALALAATSAHAFDCNGVYTGELIGHLDAPHLPLLIGVELTDFSDDGIDQYATIDGAVYRFQDRNALQISFDNDACTFGGYFQADNIFHDSFE